MRIISGSARGRKLKEPARKNIRPTRDKVKEAIFNILQFDVEGRRVLDLYAGTGQLGIEAISRGAASTVFVDSSGDAVKLVRENLRICGFSGYARVYAADALNFLKRDDKFDIILLDPPYDEVVDCPCDADDESSRAATLANKTLSLILEFDKLNENGIIICETSAATPISADDTAPPYKLEKVYKYGNIALAKIVRKTL